MELHKRLPLLRGAQVFYRGFLELRRDWRQEGSRMGFGFSDQRTPQAYPAVVHGPIIVGV